MALLGLRLVATFAQQPDKKPPSSYMPVVEDKLDEVMARMKAEKPAIRKMITIYLKKIVIEPELKTTEELMEEWRSKGKKEK